MIAVLPFLYFLLPVYFLLKILQALEQIGGSLAEIAAAVRNRTTPA